MARLGRGQPFKPKLSTKRPFAVPNAPVIGTASAGDSSASVSFTASTDDGGSAITSYTATSTPGSFTGSGANSPVTVGGLSNGTGYTFTVHATNAIGNSAESAASNSVTPSSAADVVPLWQQLTGFGPALYGLRI